MSARKLGVLGGTFDPIHLGHLHVAQRTHRLFDLAETHFVVSTSPPHKSALTALYHRYAMVCLATTAHRGYIPSLVELESPASPFSVHTMSKLAHVRDRVQRKLYFIAGADSLLDVAGWRESRELLSSHSFVFVARPGVSLPEVDTLLPRKVRPNVRDLRGLGPRLLRQRIQTEEKPLRNRIYVIDVAALEVSSSEIRQLVSSGKKVTHMLPPSTHEYIHKLNIYGDR